MIIVMLTILEVSITVWAAFQISKGASFHQLNSLHLKYNNQFLGQVLLLEQGEVPDVALLRSTIELVRQQPIDCLKQASWLDRQVMHMIDTSHALDLCQKDIDDANKALLALDQFASGDLPKLELIKALRRTSDEFVANSSAFEGPVTDTVGFIFRTMIPMIIIISLFNISFITYLSRTIARSIKHAISLLAKESGGQPLAKQLQISVSGELKELLEVAQKRIEQDLMNFEHNEKLQKLVNDKTASLRSANEELEQFSYRTSHDLKGPLTRCKRMCHFILEDIQRGKIEQACGNVRAIEQQMGSLEKLVEDLMSLAKADLVTSEQEEVRLSEVIEVIIEQQRAFFDECGVKFISQVGDSEFIICERARLIQVLGNLFSNSCKYADKSKGESWLKFTYSKDESCYTFVVEDNGIGFPEEYRAEMFKRFKRFHPGIGSGSGLGLSIIKKHLDNMEGSISYRDTGGGSLFVINLPILKPELGQNEIEK